jgi:hypothetical protein
MIALADASVGMAIAHGAATITTTSSDAKKRAML